MLTLSVRWCNGKVGHGWVRAVAENTQCVGLIIQRLVGGGPRLKKICTGVHGTYETCRVLSANGVVRGGAIWRE